MLCALVVLLVLDIVFVLYMKKGSPGTAPDQVSYFNDNILDGTIEEINSLHSLIEFEKRLHQETMSTWTLLSTLLAYKAGAQALKIEKAQRLSRSQKKAFKRRLKAAKEEVRARAKKALAEMRRIQRQENALTLLTGSLIALYPDLAVTAEKALTSFNMEHQRSMMNQENWLEIDRPTEEIEAAEQAVLSEEVDVTTAKEAGFIEGLISRFATANPQLQFLIADAPAPSVSVEVNQTNRERGTNPASEFGDDVVKLQKSVDYNLLPCLRFGRGAKGSPVVAGSTPVHDELKETRGSAVRIQTNVAAGRYMFSAGSTVSTVIAQEGVTITGDNCLLYEIDDINDVDLMKDVANILLDNGWITISRGFAVKAGTDLAMAFIDLANRTFHNAIEQRGYMRSLTTTPNQAEVPKGLPVFVGKLKQIGWFGNDGGTVFTNGLMKAFQNRFKSIGDRDALNELFKGLATACKVVARLEDDGTWMPYVYSMDEEINAKVKGVVKALKTKSRLQLLNEATAKELIAVRDIGRVTAGRIVELREKDGDFQSFDELYERMATEFGETKAKYVKSAELNFHRLAYSFTHEGKTYCVAMFIDEDQAKGCKTKLPDVGLVDAGNQGYEIYGWAIALDTKIDAARISLGWQVTQLMSEGFVAGLLEEGKSGHHQLKKLFDDILGKKNKLFDACMAQMDPDDLNAAQANATAMAMMKVLGKKMSERISSGLGAKAKSAYVQMLDLGAEVVIDRIPKNKKGQGLWRKKAFFGRTPNQGHETIRAVEVLDVQFVAMTIKRFFSYLDESCPEDKVDLTKCFQASKGYWKCGKKQKRAQKFIGDIAKISKGDCLLTRLEFILAMLPGVSEGAILVDTTLQELVCGDNDGDRNMISYDPLLVSIAGCVTKRHPSTVPAKEQSKAFVVDTFAECVKAEGGVRAAYLKFLNGDKDEMREIQVFLNAPGNAPGQDNVGGPTLTGAAPLNFHPWVWKDGVFGPTNEAARRFMDFMFALQQTAIDQQKYERVIASLRYWYKAELWEDGMICPGTPVEGKQWAVVKGKKFFGANLSESEAKEMAKENGAQAVHCPNHYEIYGFEGMTFSEYRKLGLNDWQGAAEYVPLMTGISPGRKTIKARDPMWNNTALFQFGAWTVSAINLGLPYLTFEEMKELQPAFDCSGRAVKVDWDKLAGWFTTRCGHKITAEEVERNWVFPQMVSSYQKKSFNLDNSKSPGVFRYMRARTKEIYIERCGKKGIHANYEHPVSILVEKDIVPAMTGTIEDPQKSVAYFSGWQAETLMRSMYFGYVDQASEGASRKSQSEKTQIDQVASGSEQKQFLRAALGSYGFLSVESKSLPYVSMWARTWRQALSVGGLTADQKQDYLAGMMIVGIRALQSMSKRDSSAVQKGVETALKMIRGGLTFQNIEENYVDWAKYKAHRDSFFDDENLEKTMEEYNCTKQRAIAMREDMDKAQKILKMESVLTYLAETGMDSVTAKGLEHAAMEESEDLTYQIQDWIAGDYFGALEEAFEDISRAEHRQDSDQLVIRVLGEAKWEHSSSEMVRKMVQSEYWKFIKNKAAEYNSAETMTEIMEFFQENRTLILAEYRQFINPVIQAGRLIEYANQTISTEGWFNPEESKARFQEIIYEGIFETDDEGERHIRATIEFPVPKGLQEGIVFETMRAGYNVELLTQVPVLGAIRRPNDIRKVEDTTVATKFGYIYLDSAFFNLALKKFDEEKVWSWLRAQHECGVGHVTTADQMLMAYNLYEYRNGDCENHVDLSVEKTGRDLMGYTPEYFRSYWTHSPLGEGMAQEDIIEVQKFFLSCYSHVPVLNFYRNEDAWQARYNSLVSRKGGQENSTHDILWEMQFEVTKTIFMPLFYGGKSKANSLFVGDAGDNKATPYHLYRHFGFVMSGHADKQQDKAAPVEVVDYMQHLYSFPVGVVKKGPQEWGTGFAATKHSAGNMKDKGEATKSFEKALFKKDVENWDWNHVSPVNGFMDNYLIYDIPTEKGYLPSPMDATVQAIEELIPKEDSWKAFGHLVRLSPSLFFCLAGCAGSDDVDPTLLAQMRASVKNQSVSAIRGLFRDAVRQRGFEMTLKSVTTEVNEGWNRETMMEIIEVYNPHPDQK
jgi:hypothetical protein